MLKRTIIILGLGIMGLTGTQTGAMAGGYSNGYDPLFWNGPPGYEYTVLFTKTNKYRSYSRKSCNSLKRKYKKTGKRYWLNKYRSCRADRY